MKKINLVLLFSVVIVGLSCSENTENLVAAPDDGGEEPVTDISYVNDIQPIFDSSCTSCHGSNGNVSLVSYSALMNSVGSRYGSNVVVAGNADGSGLVDKIEPNPEHGTRMPIGGTLTTSEIQTIRTWINEGANNN